MFWVVGKSAYSVNRIVIACVVTFRDLSKFTSVLGMCFVNRFILYSCCSIVHNLRAFQNVDNVPVRCVSGHP